MPIVPKPLRFAVDNLKYFLKRKQLKSRIKESTGNLQIVIGAANTDYQDWLATNIESLNLLKENSFSSLFGNKKAQRFLAEHVFEHLTLDDGLISLKNCYKYLNTGGVVRIAVPDGFHPNPDYINMVKPGGFGQGADDHKLLYNYKKLSKLFEDAGFKPSLLEYYDEDGKFHYQEWDSADGHVFRSRRYDKRFHEPIGYSSLIIDGIKD